MLRMKWFVENFAPPSLNGVASVLDVGSYDVNGCYKNLFTDVGYNYTGLDMAKGPNVDYA